MQSLQETCLVTILNYWLFFHQPIFQVVAVLDVVADVVVTAVVVVDVAVVARRTRRLGMFFNISRFDNRTIITLTGDNKTDQENMSFWKHFFFT